MSARNMFGVVLWTDLEDQKAVIWCEDHGSLAFYAPGDRSVLDRVLLDAGDLIQFDLEEACELRFARNPQLVAQSQYPGLAADLRARMGGSGRDDTPPMTNVVEFARYRDTARCQTEVA